MSLGNKGGGGTQKWVKNTMVGEGGAVNTATYTPHISEGQAPAHMGFVIPDSLFVHNIKGHLELTTVRDQSCLKNGHRKAASEDGLSLRRVELLGLPVDHCLAKLEEKYNY